MSVTVLDGDTVEKLSDEALVFAFDYDGELTEDAEFSSVGTFTIDPADGRLTKDEEALLTGNRGARVRLSGGKPGKTYVIRHTATTTEVPTTSPKALFYLFIRPEQ
jgi:hypothetical protein